ncbi:MAG: TetR/AcrR family transcriptional regulator [Ilumatobacteraceae bacterium]
MARPRRIDRDAILAASLDVADAVGVDRLTMQAVAERLGVTPMALYRHVADKADLLDGVVERLLGEIEPPDESLPPAEQLTAIGQAVRRLARRHPTVFPLLLQRPATTPAARRARDTVVELLGAMGVPDDRVAQGERVISTLILGFAASEAAGRFRRHTRKQIDADYALVEATVTHLIADLAAP